VRLEFKRVTDMSATESAAHDALRAIVYPSAPGAPPPVVPYDWVPPEWRALVWEDAGALVSTTGALVRRVLVDGHPTTIGGIGSVKTHPAVEGKGYASAGLRQAMAFLNGEMQVAFSLLVCREALVPFYGRRGWTVFRGTVLAERAGGRTEPFTFNVVMLAAGTTPRPIGGVIDLCGPPW
jgi:hypothetical protein